MPLHNYSFQPTNRSGSIHEKAGSGSKMQSCSCFANTTELALSGIDNRIGWLSLLQKKSEGRVMIGRFSNIPTGRVIVRFSIWYQSVKKSLIFNFKNHYPY